jgi:sugar lactone lactonase YvrE
LNQLNTPNGVYFDYLYTNSLYVLDSGNNRVLKFPSGSTSATFGTIVAGSNSSGNGSNQLNNPRNLVVDSNEILYITDQCERKFEKGLI